MEQFGRMGRILVIIFVIVLIVSGVWWWRNYHNANVYDGSVVRRDAAMETGTTTMENGQNLGEAHPTPSRSDYPGTVNGEPYHGDANDVAVQTTPITEDPYAQGGAYAASGSYGASGYNGVSPYGGGPNGGGPYGYNGPNAPSPRPGKRGPVYPPSRVDYGYQGYGYQGNDSQPPENPDGMRFGGNGAYQWYRQGNLTYRVDSRSGRSCIAYATMEEWRNPRVYRHACR